MASKIFKQAEICSHSKNLLKGLVGKKILRMARVAIYPKTSQQNPEASNKDLLQMEQVKDFLKGHNLHASELFACVQGPCVLEFEDGQLACFDADNRLASIIAWQASDLKEVEQNLHAHRFSPMVIDNHNKQYCSSTWNSVNGHEVEKIFIYKMKNDPWCHKPWPKERGLHIKLSNGFEFVFSNNFGNLGLGGLALIEPGQISKDFAYEKIEIQFFA